MWEPHARALAHDYHVITLDLPGHGALFDVPFTTENVAAVLDQAIDQLAAAPPLIVGYSLGGFAAIQYAAAHPERTRGLVLAGCTLDFEAWKSWPYEASVAMASAMPQPLLDNLLDLSLHLVLPDEWARVIARIPFNRDVLVRTNRYTREHARFSQTLAAYRKPVLFINGQRDLVFRLDERRYAQAQPQARLEILRGVDHTAPMRSHVAFTDIVQGFAQEVFG